MAGQRQRISWQATIFLLVSVLGARALAGVHDGGVGACNFCHSMHSATPGPGGQGPRALLVESSASDVCLRCHATQYGSVLGMDPLAPPPERGPGNFVFLLSANLNDGPDGTVNPIPGDAAGHNIRAPGHGLAADATRQTSPGGSYPASALKCTSCHDPHGNSNYRFLRGPGAGQGGGGGGFTYPAPSAVGLDLVTGGSESNANHIAYLSGMSLWCGNCHGAYLQNHNDAGGSLEHPTTDQLDADQRTQYILYNGTSDPIGGIEAFSYLAAVPFEDSGASVNSMAGPTAASRLMCLTCHRAHATSAPAAGRWDFNVSTLGADGVVSGSYPLPNPYLNPKQDSLCWKCHPGGTD